MGAEGKYSSKLNSEKLKVTKELELDDSHNFYLTSDIDSDSDDTTTDQSNLKYSSYS